jgi:hypothetical protein
MHRLSNGSHLVLLLVIDVPIGMLRLVGLSIRIGNGIIQVMCQRTVDIARYT